MSKKSTITFRFSRWQQEFNKRCLRLERAIKNGSLANWSHRKRTQFYQQLQKLAARLGQSLKPTLLAGLITSGVATNKANAHALKPEDAFHPDAAFRQLQRAYLERAYLHYDQAKIDYGSNLDFPLNRKWEVPLYKMNNAKVVPLPKPALMAAESTTAVIMRPITMDHNSDFGANYGFYGGTLNYKLSNPDNPSDPPATPSQPDLVASSDTGNQTDNITEIVQPTLRGSAQQGTTITLESNIDGVLVTDIIVDASGRWEVQLDKKLSKGKHQITAKASNEKGISAASAPLNAVFGMALSGTNNTASGTDAVVAGGKDNSASGNYSGVSSGQYNSVSGNESTIGGGLSNLIKSTTAVIGGGTLNVITEKGAGSTIGGGVSNKANGLLATIPGGFNLIAQSFGETVMGVYNDTINAPNSYNSIDAEDRLFVVGNGTDGIARSNALVMLKNGNTQLNGILSLSNGTDTLNLPNTKGTNGQVLTADGNGNATWQNAGGGSGAFATSGSVTSNSPGTLATDDFVFGSDQLDDKQGTTDDDARFFFDKSKAAFRAGQAIGTVWSESNTGSFSTVTGGFNNKAAGTYSSVSGGKYNQVFNNSAYSAIVGGTINNILFYTNYSIIGGGKSNVVGYTDQNFTSKNNANSRFNADSKYSAIVGGLNNKIFNTNAPHSFIGGGKNNTVKGGEGTIGGGLYNSVIGINAATISGGRFNEASGSTSTVGGGGFNKATDTYSTIAGGKNNEAGNGAMVGGGIENKATGVDAFIGGGEKNEATGSKATISGGIENKVTQPFSTIGGGYQNEASGFISIVGGGKLNKASNYVSTVGGGVRNEAQSVFSTVGGGNTNHATGNAATIPGGVDLRAKSFGETVIGIHNDTTDYTPNNTAGFDAADRLFVIGNGTADNARSNALVMLKNGNTQLNGILSLSNGTDTLNLPNTKGTNGQVLTADGNGNATWQNAGGGSGAFATSENVTSNSPGTLATDDFVFGSDQLGDANDASKDARFFFDKSKAAFRAGIVTGVQWNDDLIGEHSTVTGGYNNIAEGTFSSVSGGKSNGVFNSSSAIVGGIENEIRSSTNYSIIGGGKYNTVGYSNDGFTSKNNANSRFNADSKYSAIVGGLNNKIFNYNAPHSFIGGGKDNTVKGGKGTIGGGENNIITGIKAATISGGRFNEASGYASTVGGGEGNEASGENATVGGGDYNISSGENATIGGGAENEASDSYSTVGGGYSNKATHEYSTVSGGSYNEATGENATIGGGEENEATGSKATISGGQQNQATGLNSTIAGGSGNKAQRFASVGGGRLNHALGEYATIAGGNENQAANNYTSIGGGENNIASGYYATIPGGVGLVAKSFGENVIGVNNDTLNYTPNGISSFDATDRLFVIGNGTTANARSNALVLLKNGNLGLGNPFATAPTNPTESIEHANGAKLTTTGIWMNASDRSRKTNIKEMEYGLDEILALHPVTYDYKKGGSHSLGFIAQEVEKILPELVNGKEGDKALAYSLLTSVIVKAMQEMDANQDKLETEIDDLQKENEALKQLQTKLVSLKAENNELKAMQAKMARMETMMAQLLKNTNATSEEETTGKDK